MATWLSVPEDSDFSIRNLPYGIFSTSSLSSPPRAATILGDTVIDLSVLEEAGLFADIHGLQSNVFGESTLNRFLEHEKHVWTAVRQRLVELLSTDNNDALQSNAPLQKAAFHNSNSVQLYLPIQVGDYTDFYSSREHATNVGTMFRGKDNALQPNWLHLPVGYHGRSSTVFCSGHQFHRPCGQLQKDKDDPTQGSVYGPCKLLDFELEMAAVVGGPANTTSPLSLQQAKDRLFGFMLMNDWSARDIQKWEYVPLGPFTSKNFATTVSPWIVPTDALQEYVAPTSAGQQDNPVPLPYLQDVDYASYDVALTVAIQSSQQSQAHTVCQSNFKNLYWNAAQQLCHHSVTGCIMKAGDLLGSGTISGTPQNSFGSMLELSWKGTREVQVGDEIRKFLKDGDTVIMKGVCHKEGQARVGFGDCVATILPALTEASPAAAIAPNQDRYFDFKLYSYWRSSSTWRVRVALVAKSISYTTIMVNLMKFQHKVDSYLAKNPLGQVPMLECTDRVTGRVLQLTQSIAIVEFLEEAFPDRRSLMPRDPQDKAAAREMVQIINSGTQPQQNIFYLRSLEEQSEGKLKAAEQAKAANEKGLKALELLVTRRRSEESAGPYCLGSFSPTIVDSCMVPQIYNARRFGVDVDQVCPALVEIDALCAKHPWFQVSHPIVQPDAVTE